MLARVADELGRRVEAHRLGVEQGRAEDVRMMAFHPGRGIGDLGEAGGVAFGEAVAAEALDLLEGALGEIPVVAAGRSCRSIILSRKWLTPPVDLKVAIERRSASASAGGEAGADDRDLHRLLLEERHAQGLVQHLLELGLGIFDRLLALAPAQIGMDHVALDRPRPDDRDLDDDVVECRGFSRGSIDICARLSIWKMPIVSALRIMS